MKIQRTHIERVDITGSQDERKEAVEYLKKNGYNIIHNYLKDEDYNIYVAGEKVIK